MPSTQKKTKFVLYTQGRAGSTLLRDLLNDHPDIHCDREAFTIKSGHIKARQVKHLIHKRPKVFLKFQCDLSSQLVYGFTFMDHLLPEPKKFINELYFSGWKIIYVTRRDLLAQCFSNLLAHKTNIWHRRANNLSPDFKLNIKREDFMNELNWWLQRRKNDENILQGLNTHQVIYEDTLQDQANWPKTTKKLFEHLGVDSYSVSSTLKKTYSRHYSEIIENYKELIAHLKKTEYSYLIPKIQTK